MEQISMSKVEFHMNVSAVEVPVSSIIMVCGTDAAYHPKWGILPTLEAKQKKRISPQSVLQFGQVMSFLFPAQMADILLLAGNQKEADLIRRWFIVGEDDISGMLNMIPGAWTLDRIVKHICKTESLCFEWVDKDLYVDGLRRFYGMDGSEHDLSCYSRPLAEQFGGGLMDRVRDHLKAHQ
jgi:hypothetical protein